MKTDNPYYSEILKQFMKMSSRRSTFELFCDFIETAAISLLNLCPATRSEEKEAEYLRIMKHYEGENTPELFAKLMGNLMMAIEHEVSAGSYRDIMGEVFHELRLHNKWRGQFFTPGSVCKAMASMSLGDDLVDKIRSQGFISVSEPSSGSGAMVLALGEAMRGRGFSPEEQMVATLWDIDPRCVHMAFLQMSLYGIPARVVLGDSLKMEAREVWHTANSLAFFAEEEEATDDISLKRSAS